MISFMDSVFSGSPKCTNECGRQLTPELLERAKEWCEGDNPTISYSYFCSTTEVE